jgi:hypothetical protein
VDTLLRAAEIGVAEGLRFVYAGNIPGQVRNWENTYCPGCGARLIERVGFRVRENRLRDGRCPDCSAAVAAFSQLERALRAGADANAGRHPEPAQLVAIDADPRSVPTAQWQEVDRHLRSCRSCADELAALRGVDFEGLASSAPARPVDALRALGRSLAETFRSVAARARGATEDALSGIAPEPAVVPQAAAARETAARPLAVLVALGERAGQVFPLFEGEARLGRDPACEVRIVHDSLPRVAARIRISSQHCQIEALALRPPLLVNGRAATRSELADGDRVRLGDEELEFRRVGARRSQRA